MTAPSGPHSPQAPTPPPIDALRAPSLRRRMASWLYEGVLLFGVVVPAGLLFSVVADMRHALEQRTLFVGFLFLVLGAYCTFFWWKGQTLAMKTWRLRVLDRQGRRLTPLRAAIRYVFCWIWILPPLAAFQSRRVSVTEVMVLFVGWVAIWALLSRFHPQRQFWHDAFAGTRLVSQTAP